MWLLATFEQFLGWKSLTVSGNSDCWRLWSLSLTSQSLDVQNFSHLLLLDELGVLAYLASKKHLQKWSVENVFFCNKIPPGSWRPFWPTSQHQSVLKCKVRGICPESTPWVHFLKWRKIPRRAVTLQKKNLLNKYLQICQKKYARSFKTWMLWAHGCFLLHRSKNSLSVWAKTLSLRVEFVKTLRTDTCGNSLLCSDLFKEYAENRPEAETDHPLPHLSCLCFPPRGQNRNFPAVSKYLPKSFFVVVVG